MPISPSSCSSSFPARPTNGTPLLVLARAGRLADEHQFRVGVAGPEHDRFAGRRELRAARAAARLHEDLLQGLTPLGRRLLTLPGGHRADGKR